MSTTGRVGELTLNPRPRIEGISVRPFDDPRDYEPLAELMRLAHVEDAIPWLPTGQNLQVEMRNATGLEPADDVVVVELDGRMIASSKVERNMRDGVPTYEFWRHGRSRLSAAWHRDRADGLGARSRTLASRPERSCS